MFREFFKLESSGGILLAIAAILAMIIENSPGQKLYQLLLTLPVTMTVGTWSLGKPLLLWINDGLMAIFFLLVSLEIKREAVEGELSTPKQLTLPVVAAIGGLVTPALFYSYINWGDPMAMRGWAIPAATDIAFALGILSLLGSRVPKNLKVCLVGIAILDDIACILIIALFYTQSLSIASLLLGTLAIAILCILSFRKVQSLTPYILTGIFLWVCVLKSGVHATLAGVILGLFIPIHPTPQNKTSMLKKLEHDLHPWVAYGILPIFAFANAGVSLEGLSLDSLLQPIALGIILGLSIGAPVGVLTMTGLFRLFNVISLPKGVTVMQYMGMSLLTGVGFTMSLFIGTLAFDDFSTQNTVRLGVISGSLISGVLGTFALLAATKKKRT